MSGIQHHRRLKGFTIVELLIVIVIISILVTISIIGYASITQRTENSKTVAAVQAMIAVMTKIKTETGKYPLSSEVGNTYPCVGQYPNNKCASISDVVAAGMGGAITSPQLETLIRLYNNNILPQPSTQSPTIDGQALRGSYLVLGSTVTSGYGITWIQSGTGECGIENALKSFEDSGGRVCSLSFSE